MISCSGPLRTSDKNCVEAQILYNKAERLLHKYPDSTLYYASHAFMLVKPNYCNDTLLIAFLQLKAAAFLTRGNPDSSQTNYEKARNLATLLSFKPLKATIDLKLAGLLLDRGNVHTAEKYICEAIGLLDSLNNRYKMGEAYNLYGSLLLDKGDLLKSQEYLLKALACLENSGNLAAISSVCINIGSNYKEKGFRSEALLYYRKALDLGVKAADTAIISSSLNNIGVFYRVSSPDSSLVYYKRSLALSHPGKNSISEIISRYNIANLYFDRKEFDKAKSEYLTLLEICRSGKNTGGIARIYTGLSAIASKTGNYQLAEQYLKDAIYLSDSIGDKHLNIYSLNELEELYTKTGAYKQALELTVIIQAKGDSLLGLKKRLAVHDMEMLYQTEKKDAENARLKYQVNRQQARLEYRLIVISLLILFTLAMGILIFRLYKLNRQRGIAYHQLVSKYKQESEMLSRLRSVKFPVVSNELKSETANSEYHLLERLIEFFVLEKPYLDSRLKVADVAEKLNSSQKAIAAALKGHTDSNFNAFTNRFRVDTAIAMMDNPSFKHYKIEAIAKDSGFGSKSNFYDTFESFTGVKPNYYRSFMGKNGVSDARIA